MVSEDGRGSWLDAYYQSKEREREREREREFIGTNIKQFHAKIKLRRWDTEKNLQSRLSRRAPLESFINFYRGLKLIYRNRNEIPYYPALTYRNTLLSSSVNLRTDALTSFVCVSSDIRANNICT